MNVLLLHLDGRLPNIALMRIAAHHRAMGDHVELRRAGNERALIGRDDTAARQAIEPRLDDQRWDRVYGSLVFERTRPLARRVLELYPKAMLGGTGWVISSNLSDVGIDDGPLDYADYPRWRQSIGFTQRGCRLACRFCVVPQKEGKARPAATIGEIWRGEPWPRQLLLLDNDFFGSPLWPARIDEIKAGEFSVCLNQGINARFLNDETATAVASIDYRDDQMKRKRIYTAWDGRKDEKRLFRGLEALARAGVKPDDIMVYMLIGEDTAETHEDRDYRRRKLRDFGARPYPMPFRREPELVGFQRWVIGAYDKAYSWDAWRAAKYEPRKLGERRVSLPLFEGS